MLAKAYDSAKNDPTGMWASEKFDGVRSLFLPSGKFISRNGNEFFAPKWFIDAMPKGALLDGELFTKRGDFQNIMSIVSKNIPVDSEWKKIKFLVFDLPLVKLPVEERMPYLVNIVETARSKSAVTQKYLHVVKNTLLNNAEHLEKLYESVVAKGGEGVMLRVPGTYYENKRSKYLLKYKKFTDDEGVVENWELGTGKYTELMGKLVVKWLKGSHKGVRFKVGTGFSDNQRKNYKQFFPKGTIVKIKYFELSSKGVPRFPVFLGVRDKRDLG